MSNSGKGLEFARGLLEKYGWKEGQGLGRNKNGLTKALKPTLKFDCGGIGYNGVSEQFTSRWWEQSYNEIANNICVIEKKEGVKVKHRNKEELFKKKESRPVSSCTTTEYNSFVKTSLLTGEGILYSVKSDSNEDTTLEKSIGNVAPMGLTDEEIFQACGGRTVHKGARHGLKLGGKLARIERQEEHLLRFQLHDVKSCAFDNQDSVEYSNSYKRHGLLSVFEKGTPKKIHEVGDESAFSGEKQKKRKKKKNNNNKLSPNALFDCDLELPAAQEEKLLDNESNETLSAVYSIPDSTCSIPLDSNFNLENKTSKKKKKKKDPDECEGENGKAIDFQVISESPESQKKRMRNRDKDTNEHTSKTWGKNVNRASKAHYVDRVRLQSGRPVISSEQSSPPLLNSLKESIPYCDLTAESLVKKSKKRKHKS